jgi:metallo-beta-lactamase family protein
LSDDPDLMTGGSISLAFHGAAGTVTGSRFLVRTPNSSALVDAGLFQGLRQLRRRNWDELAFDPAVLDAVVVSHAHLDHTGFLPVIVRRGFAGRILATADTARLAEVVLRDSAKLQEEDAQYAARSGFSKHAQPRPLYDRADVERTLPLMQPVEFDTAVDLTSDLELRMRPAGHILGSASVLLEHERGTVLFSGDLGRTGHPLLRPPEPPPSVDTLVIESTYGNRRHLKVDAAQDALADVIRSTVARGGTVVIPAFAVDRTEVLLVALGELLASGQIPPVPVYLDSPMALQVLDIYRDALVGGRTDVRPGLEQRLDLPGLHEAHTADASRALNQPDQPSILISASGMATGGRVVHHLKHLLPEPRNAVVLVGYQAEGTRGRDLVDGAGALKMHGRYIPVRADVRQIEGFSVHADEDGLVAWASQMARPPTTTYIVHGEPEASAALLRRFRSQLGWNAVVPRFGETVRIDRP